MNSEQVTGMLSILERVSIQLLFQIEFNPIHWYLFRRYKPVIYHGYIHIMFRILFLSICLDVYYPTSKTAIRTEKGIETLEE